MYPNFFYTTYKRYKDDTNNIASWLATTARRCGYPSDLLTNEAAKKNDQSAPKLKGRARKLARDAAKTAPAKQQGSQSSDVAAPKRVYTIARKDFTTLADFIASYNKPAVQVPAALLKLVNRAITLRKRHARWYSQDPTEENLRSNASHDYFIGVLEKVRDTLKPRCSLDVPAQSTDTQDDYEVTSNLFESLTVDESTNRIHDAPTATKKLQDKHNESNERFVAEEVKTPQEKYLAAHCLFHDIAKIREFVGKIWSVEAFDLMNCAVATNTAIDLVRQAQRDFEKEFGAPFKYEEVAGHFYAVQCRSQGFDPEKRVFADDPINFEAAGVANFVMLPVYILLGSFKDVLRDGSIPLSKPGYFGSYDPKSDRQQKSARQQFEEDKVVLAEIMSDVCWLTAITPGIPAEDNFTRMARVMRKEGIIELWGIFAAQLFVDINHVRRASIDHGLLELQRYGRKVKLTLETNLEFHKSLRIVNWPKSNDKIFQNIFVMMDEFVFNDPVQTIIWRFNSSVPIPSFRLMKRHPVFCGLLALHLNLTMQQAGIIFSNAWGSALYLAHLYNAVKQEGLLKRTWPDMELIISFHTKERVFVGGEPTNVEDYLKRLSLTMGVSAQAFAPNKHKAKRSIDVPLSSRGPRSLLEDTTPVAELYRAKLCGEIDATEFLSFPEVDRILTTRSGRTGRGAIFDRYWPILQQVFHDSPQRRLQFEEGQEQMFMEAGSELTEQAPKEAPSAHTRDTPMVKDRSEQRRQRWSREQSLSPVELLEALFDAMSDEVTILKFDYFAMHRRCWQVLRKLNEQLGDDFKKYLGAGYLEREDQLPFVVGYIFQIAVTSQRIARDCGLGVETYSKIMSKAAGVLDEYLASGLGSMEMMRLLRDGGRNLRFDDIEFVMDDEDLKLLEAEEVYEFSNYVDAMAAIRGNQEGGS